MSVLVLQEDMKAGRPMTSSQLGAWWMRTAQGDTKDMSIAAQLAIPNRTAEQPHGSVAVASPTTACQAETVEMPPQKGSESAAAGQGRMNLHNEDDVRGSTLPTTPKHFAEYAAGLDLDEGNSRGRVPALYQDQGLSRRHGNTQRVLGHNQKAGNALENIRPENMHLLDGALRMKLLATGMSSADLLTVHLMPSCGRMFAFVCIDYWSGHVVEAGINSVYLD